MRLVICSIVLLFLSGILLNVRGQLPPARQEMSLYRYARAIPYLQKAFGKKDVEIRREAAFLLGECYRKIQDWPHAGEWYVRALEYGCSDPICWYWIAQALRSEGDYPEAKIRFLLYDSMQMGDPRGRIYAGFCDSAMTWMDNLPGYEIHNVVSLNTSQSEFGVVGYEGGIIFASDRPSPAKPDKTYGWTGNSFLRLFIAPPEVPHRFSGNFNMPEPAPGLFNQEWHDGPVSFSQDFSEAFINRTLLYPDKGKKESGFIRTHLLKLFSVTRKDGKWSRPQPFYLNNDTFSIGHPALTPHGDTLYFVSDMEGGFGGTDLYRCIRREGRWSKPENLGVVINSSGNEMFPFTTGDGTLWFSSDGHPGFGGLDLFYSYFSGKVWSLPVNAGIPLNSPRDDFSISFISGSGEGFFSSGRPGGAGSDDIYWFRKLPVRIQPLAEVRDTSLQSAITRYVVASEENQYHLTTLELNKPYRLENIYYDFDRWEIREDARPALDSLVNLMKKLPITIELGSHTDCRGSEDYNEELSLKRAESAVQYIVNAGIDPGRITAKGYGKSHLLNGCDCSDIPPCSEEQHQVNRRTEFRILSVSSTDP